MVTGEFLKENCIKEMEGGPSVPGLQFVPAPSFAAHFDLALGDVFLLSSPMVPRFGLPRIYSALLHYGRLCTHLISFIELEAPWRGKILLATFFNLQQQILWKKIKEKRMANVHFLSIYYTAGKCCINIFEKVQEEMYVVCLNFESIITQNSQMETKYYGFVKLKT